MSRQVVTADKAPAAVGPYSHAIIANGFVFASGQAALVPGTKSLKEGGVREQTVQTLENIKAVLEAAGTSLDKVVKTTVFMVDLKDFSVMNETYATYFASNPPARSTVQVAALPLGALVEIEVVALAE
jgi:2-iminobutanoate/2-iminopropanoate deaminase